MREGLVPAPEALAIMLGGAGPLGEETVDLAKAAGRVLARDLTALRSQPPFAASAMDGYAIRAADSSNPPSRLKVIGESAAGRPFAGSVRNGDAVRIFTGGMLPAGADAVTMQENTERDGEFVVLHVSEPLGRSVRRAGLDFEQGQRLLQAGDALGPAQLSLAASMGHARLPVCRKPVIALFATGDELVRPGEATGPGQIVASNVYGIAAILSAAGGDVRDLGIVADTPQALSAAFASANAIIADVIVTTGGASVGDHDLVKPAILAAGGTMRFEKIAMRPGKPMLFATSQVDGRTIRQVGLSGNPVSSLIAAQVFVRPLVARMAGASATSLEPVSAVLGAPLRANDEREDYLRAQISRREDGVLLATPFEIQDSSMLANLARADCLLVRPPHVAAANVGDPCKVILLCR